MAGPLLIHAMPTHIPQHTRSQPTDKSKDVTCVEWSRDGERVLTGCYDGVARSVV